MTTMTKASPHSVTRMIATPSRRWCNERVERQLRQSRGISCATVPVNRVDREPPPDESARRIRLDRSDSFRFLSIRRERNWNSYGDEGAEGGSCEVGWRFDLRRGPLCFHVSRWASDSSRELNLVRFIGQDFHGAEGPLRYGSGSRWRQPRLSLRGRGGLCGVPRSLQRHGENAWLRGTYRVGRGDAMTGAGFAFCGPVRN
jgi:hypothetical protein